MNRIYSAALLTALLGGCASPSPQTVTPTRIAANPATPAKPAASPAQGGIPPYQDPANLLSQKRSVYFDLDQYAVSQQHRSMIQAHAAYLAGHRDQKIRIEGNADENGSREYNLALGQKRAAAVRNTLVLLGATDAQIEAVSWGEERPKATGHDEASWAENRRADIRYGNEK